MQIHYSKKCSMYKLIPSKHNFKVFGIVFNLNWINDVRVREREREREKDGGGGLEDVYPESKNPMQGVIR